jgi:hypothetical protein
MIICLLASSLRSTTDWLCRPLLVLACRSIDWLCGPIVNFSLYFNVASLYCRSRDSFHIVVPVSTGLLGLLALSVVESRHFRPLSMVDKHHSPWWRLLEFQ